MANPKSIACFISPSMSDELVGKDNPCNDELTQADPNLESDVLNLAAKTLPTRNRHSDNPDATCIDSRSGPDRLILADQPSAIRHDEIRCKTTPRHTTAMVIIGVFFDELRSALS